MIASSPAARRRRAALLALVACTFLATVPAEAARRGGKDGQRHARSEGSHGHARSKGSHGRSPHHGGRPPVVVVNRYRPSPRFFWSGSLFLGRPYPYQPYYYPYPPAYYPYPVYAPPDPGYPDPGYSEAPPPPPEVPPVAEVPPEAPPDPDDALQASYGLVQIQGVPDGAAVDLDGRFWLSAQLLDQRWLAVPRGPHTITVRTAGGLPEERRIEVSEGGSHVIRFGEAAGSAS